MTGSSSRDMIGAEQTCSAVTIAVEDSVLWLTLNRPEVLNSINAEMVQGLHAAAARATRPDVRAVVVRGEGRAFCAGADLDQVPGAEIDLDLLRRTVAEIREVVDRIASLRKPVIAGVNGVAAAGGLEIILACDLVIATKGSRIADAHSNYGLLPGAGGSYRLPRRVGPSLAKRLMFTGEFVPAEDLTECGFVARVVDVGDLEPVLKEVAADLARRSPRVLAAMKDLVDGSHTLNSDEASDAETTALHAYMQGPDILEGLSAFREGRRPRFED